MSKNYIHIIPAIFFILFFSTPGNCGDLNKLYSTDYDGFWNYWNETKNLAILCTDVKNTSLFLENAIETLSNAEIYEANAEVIEKLALTSPECMLAGLSGQPAENQLKLFKHFLITPIYNDASLIEKSFNRIWDKSMFLNLKASFYKVKESS